MNEYFDYLNAVEYFDTQSQYSSYDLYLEPDEGDNEEEILENDGD